MKYYIIRFESGEVLHGEFSDDRGAINYAESVSSTGFKMEKYDNEEDYLEAI